MASSEISKRTSSPIYRAYPPAFKRANLRWSIVSLRRYAVCWCFNQSGPKRQPYGGDFHFAVWRLNPGNNSLREIPIKETVALPSEQFYLTTELSNVVASHSFSSRASADTLAVGGMHFRQENSPSTDYETLFLYQNFFLVHT